MKKIIVLLVIALSSACFGQEIDLNDKDNVAADIKAMILKDFQNSTAEVQVYMIKANLKAYEKIMTTTLSGCEIAALDKLVERWYPRFEVILHYLKNEIKAMKELEGM